MDSTAKNNQSRGRIKLLVRLLITGGLLALVYQNIDPAALLSSLKKLNLQTLLLLAAMYLSGQLLSTLRWKVFLDHAGVKRSLLDVTRAYFFGMLMNTFGLGTVGGDVARALSLRPQAGERTAALATAVADRIQGLIVLLMIGAISILVVSPPTLPWIIEVFSALGIVVLLFMWWLGPKYLLKLFPVGHRFGNAAIGVANAFPKAPLPFFSSMFLSASMHTIQIFMTYVIAQALHLDISLGFLFATIPLINAASTLPISINGLGVREAMYVLLFEPAGIPREAGVACAAIWILIVTPISAVFGLLLQPRFDSRQSLMQGDPQADAIPAENEAREKEKRRALA